MIKKNIIWIVFAGVVIALFFFLKKNNSANQSSGEAVDLVSQQLYDQATNAGFNIIGYTPPPGYGGYVNGPFSWGGVGNPPDGVWYTQGNPIYGTS
jgi:hypothetical protein